MREPESCAPAPFGSALPPGTRWSSPRRWAFSPDCLAFIAPAPAGRTRSRSGRAREPFERYFDARGGRNVQGDHLRTNWRSSARRCPPRTISTAGRERFRISTIPPAPCVSGNVALDPHAVLMSKVRSFDLRIGRRLRPSTILLNAGHVLCSQSGAPGDRSRLRGRRLAEPPRAQTGG